MTIYEPGTVPQEILDQLSDVGQRQVSQCHACATDKGVCFYKISYDHVMVVLIIGSATQAVMSLRKLYRSGLPVFFLGHTPHVVEWGKKYCEEIGTLFRYKEPV